jgi:hypothetical protein
VITFKKIEKLNTDDYHKIKSVLDFDLDVINRNLSLSVWEAFYITGENTNLILFWQVKNGFLVLLAVVGFGLKYVEKSIKEIAKNNNLDIEIPTHSKALVRLYRRFGFVVKSYILEFKNE